MGVGRRAAAEETQRLAGGDLVPGTGRNQDRIAGADIDAPWLLDGESVLRVNGVDVAPLVEAPAIRTEGDAEHLIILEACQTKDTQTAVATLTHHLTRSSQRLLEALRNER